MRQTKKGDKGMITITAEGPVRLNLGAGDVPLDGYVNLDRKTGQEVYPLAYPDGSVDEVRASHVLEHFPVAAIELVLREWARVLKPGGVLKVAVPDFACVAANYLQGAQIPVQGYVMGGQTDQNDFHKTIFDEDSLREALQIAGLRCVSRWKSDIKDCASLPISLNLMALKPGAPMIGNIHACMSVPRLGFQDNFFCAMQALFPLGIKLRKFTGAFWGQCLTRTIEQSIEDGADWILTIDYDTVFTGADIERLISIAHRYPDAHAIAPIQAHRCKNTPLMTVKGDDGDNIASISGEYFTPEISRAHTAHFGLTLINVEKIKALPKPWFLGVPAPDGTWSEAKQDDDIYFWKQWEAVGNNLYIANRIPVGHLELMIRWPGKDMAAFYQHSTDFWTDGHPPEVWI